MFLPRAAAYIEALSRPWWKFLMVVLANAASFWLLFKLEHGFTALTGKAVFDTQNNLDVAGVRAELPLYTGDALLAYWRFVAFDFIFPFVAALFLAVLWALLLRLNPAPWMQRFKTAPWPLLAFAVTVFDWLENTGFLVTLWFAPNPPAWPIGLALLFKRFKLIGLSASGVVTALLCVALVVALVQASRQRKRPH